MPESGRCVYCGSKAGKYQHICGQCYKKRQVVRKLIAIGKMIKRQVEEEHIDTIDSEGIPYAGEKTQNSD